MKCVECEAMNARPEDASLGSKTFDQSYPYWKERAFFELWYREQRDHHLGCGCRVCSVNRGIVHKVFGQQAWS